MNHLDEGTIHTWLDGALDATQSAEADAHLKSCAECSAKVAEARGLIAASSRILVSLDDVPANVIPKKVPVTFASLSAGATKRPRRMAPWVSGLAAAAILVTLWRTSGVEQPTARSEIKVPDIRVVSEVPQPTLSELQQPALPSPPAAAPVEQRQSKVANQARTQDGRSAAGAGAVAGVATGAASDLASARTSTAPVTADRALRREATEEARRALIPAAASPIAEAAQADFADAPTRLSGCYLFPGRESKAKDALATVVGAAEAVAKTTARTRASAPTPTAASAPVARSDAAAPAAAVVRLDTTAAAPRGFQLRDARNESQRGTWEPINRDSVRVIMPAVGTFTFAIYEKVTCPER